MFASLPLCHFDLIFPFLVSSIENSEHPPAIFDSEKTKINEAREEKVRQHLFIEMFHMEKLTLPNSFVVLVDAFSEFNVQICKTAV